MELTAPLSNESGANRDELSPDIWEQVKRLNPILAAMGNRVRKGRVPSKELRSDARAKSDVARNYRIPGTAAFMSLDSLKAEHLSYKQKMSVQFGLGAPLGKVLRPHSPFGTAKFQFNSGYPDQQVWCRDSTVNCIRRRRRLMGRCSPDQIARLRRAI